MNELSYPVFRDFDINGFTAVIRLQKLVVRAGISELGQRCDEIQAALSGKLFVVRWRDKVHEFDHENGSKVTVTISFRENEPRGYIGEILLFPPQASNPTAFNASAEFTLHRSTFDPLFILFRRDVVFKSVHDWDDEQEVPGEGPHARALIKRVEFEVPEMPRRFLSLCGKPRPESTP